MTQRIAVLGSGTMGGQIALAFARGGHPAWLWGRSPESLEGARRRVEQAGEFLVGAGLSTAAEVAQAQDRVHYTADMPEALDAAAFAIEAVVEDLEVKQHILRAAEDCLADNSTLSSTTSAISPTLIQRALRRPRRFVVAHFAQPAHLVRLVEVVPGEDTAEEHTRRTWALLEAIGSMPVLAPDIPGFLFVRIQHAVLRELASLVSRGLVSAETCDTVLKQGYGVRLPAMGAFEHADLAGLDLMGGEAAAAVWADLSNATSPADTALGDLRAQGHLGMRTGRGFYDWTVRDADAFRRDRDDEIVRRLLIQAGGTVAPPQSDESVP